MGQKYFGLNELGIKVVIDDAKSFTERSKEKYDLVLFDVYVGNKVPKVFNETAYIKSIKKLTKDGGIIAFNRLFARGYTESSKEFHQVLQSSFSKVIPVFGEANVIFICDSS